MVNRAQDHYALHTSRPQTLLCWRRQRCARDTLPIAGAQQDDDARWYHVKGFTEPPRVAQREVGREETTP